MSSGRQKEGEIGLPPIFVLGTQVRLMSSVCLWYRLFKMKDEGLWRGSSHSLSLIYTHKHTHESITTVSVLALSIVKVISYAVEYLTNTLRSNTANRNYFWLWWQNKARLLKRHNLTKWESRYRVEFSLKRFKKKKWNCGLKAIKDIREICEEQPGW